MVSSLSRLHIKLPSSSSMSLHTHISHLRFIFFFSTLLLSHSSSNLEYPCKPPHYNHYQFCNQTLSTSSRAHSLISHLTLYEKTQQLSDNATGIPRLGIPTYQWWSESLHGIATNGPGITFQGSISAATQFPQVILSAAAFNRSLWFLIGAAVAVEARAMHNAGQAGLTFWAPNVNVFRDPRWGRGQETVGEDPLVGSAYAVQYVKGLQGGGNGGRRRRIGFGEVRVLEEEEDDDGELMLSACCKHTIAYDLEDWGNFSRYSFNAVVTEQDMEDTFMPPFRGCVHEGKATCLMCSYNQVNGVPACARKDLLEKARREWDMKGYIVSDCNAVATITEYQNYTKTIEEAVAISLKAGLCSLFAGMDINCGSSVALHAESAITQGRLHETDIDRALFNLFSIQIRLGLYDGDPRQGKFGKLGPKNVCTKEHKMLALEATRQGIVLLKNDKNFLPLISADVSSLAVIGPLANNGTNIGGDYTGYSCKPQSLYEGLKGYVKKTTFAAGCADVPCVSDAGFDEAVHIAQKADFVIVVAGLDLSQETEDHDRVSLLLPGKQMSLVLSVASVSKKPIILVLTGGGPIDVSFAKSDPRISSILWVGYPGEAGPKALAEVIFGEYNPGGRLPMTWYPESFTKVPMNDMNMRADPSRGYPGRTYRFYNGDQVYSFGHGLSYTNYSYSLLSAPNKLTVLRSSLAIPRKRILSSSSRQGYVLVQDIASCDSLKFYVVVSVTNSGEVDGSHVVLLFARVPEVTKGTPLRQLVGFDRMHTVSGSSAETSILVDPCKHLSVADEGGKRVMALGNHVLMLGDLEHTIAVGPL
ncbi:Probable beta-D-xylosidase 6 [Linum perenne]